MLEQQIFWLQAQSCNNQSCWSIIYSFIYPCSSFIIQITSGWWSNNRLLSSLRPTNYFLFVGYLSYCVIMYDRVAHESCYLTSSVIERPTALNTRIPLTISAKLLLWDVDVINQSKLWALVIYLILGSREMLKQQIFWLQAQSCNNQSCWSIIYSFIYPYAVHSLFKLHLLGDLTIVYCPL